jgi:hypothetical protein
VDEDLKRIYMERIHGVTVKERMFALQLDNPAGAQPAPACSCTLLSSDVVLC